MYTDLRDWENAKKLAQQNDSINLSELIRLQATWAEEIGDWKGAVEMWLAANEPMKAIT